MDIREEIKKIEQFQDTVTNGILHSNELYDMSVNFKRVSEHAKDVLFEMQHHFLKWSRAAFDDSEALREILVHFWDDWYPEPDDRSPAAKKKRDDFDKLSSICDALYDKYEEYEELFERVRERIDRINALKNVCDEAEKALLEGELTDAMREAEAVIEGLKKKV